MVRTRIAPSPTGFAHIGTAYTALFNYAFARKNKGKFIVRIEDTDRKRHVTEAERAIFAGLSWLGLSWDESTDIGGPFTPYRQSERLSIYQQKVDELLKNGFAYEDSGAIRFKNPNEDISWQDLIHGDIKFPGKEVTDFVIIKSDGFPTYNFAVVIDDILMEITHVIRGEEHISNTPRQIALYKAFNVNSPFFAHHPTLRNTDHKKLSKRRDPVDLRIFKEKGYLPAAMINFLCLLGWSHPDEQEIFDLAEFVKLFDLNRVRKSGPVFDNKKLDWINGEYIRKSQVSELKSQISDFLGNEYNQNLIEKSIPLIKTRINKLDEYLPLAGFFFKDMKVDKKLLGKNYKKHLVVAVQVLADVKTWTKELIEEVLLKAVNDHDFKTGDFFMDLRVSISGAKVTPPMGESLEILGKEEVLDRLKKVII